MTLIHRTWAAYVIHYIHLRYLILIKVHDKSWHEVMNDREIGEALSIELFGTLWHSSLSSTTTPPLCPNPFSMHCSVHVCVIAAISSSYLVIKGIRLLEFGIELSCLSDQPLCLVDPAAAKMIVRLFWVFQARQLLG